MVSTFRAHYSAPQKLQLVFKTTFVRFINTSIRRLRAFITHRRGSRAPHGDGRTREGIAQAGPEVGGRRQAVARGDPAAGGQSPVARSPWPAPCGL